MTRRHVEKRVDVPKRPRKKRCLQPGTETAFLEPKQQLRARLSQRWIRKRRVWMYLVALHDERVGVKTRILVRPPFVFLPTLREHKGFRLVQAGRNTSDSRRERRRYLWAEEVVPHSSQRVSRV